MYTKAGITSMILGIIGTCLTGLFSTLFGTYSIILGIFGIIFAIIGFKALSDGKIGKGFTIAGLITSIISFFLGIWGVLMWGAFVAVVSSL